MLSILRIYIHSVVFQSITGKQKCHLLWPVSFNLSQASRLQKVQDRTESLCCYWVIAMCCRSLIRLDTFTVST